MSTFSEDARSRHRRLARQFFDPRWSPTIVTSAPGRIELIGNHLDYNGGPVLAAAIDKRIFVSARQNSSGFINAIFADFDENRVHSISSGDLADWNKSGSAPEPVDYLRGGVAALLNHESPINDGLDLVVSGDLAHGVGMSSSAALCVALTMAVSTEDLDRHELVLLAQEAENRTGSPCGTMDQSASVFGGVIRFDGATNAVATLEADLGDLQFAVASSGVVRSLATSSYPKRVIESREAVEVLRDAIPGRNIQNLAEIPTSQLGNVQAIMTHRRQASLFPRVRHVIMETERVKRAEIALKVDWEIFGALMTEGGRSSAIDYEISHPRVEELIAICLDVEGVLGAKMMGGGEGGSALVLLKSSVRDALGDALTSRYFEPHHLANADDMLLTCRFDRGAERLIVP